VLTRGFPYEFTATPWDDIIRNLEVIADQNESFSHVVAIARSVRDSHCASLLAGTTSMHDLLVTTVPIMSAPVDVIHVYAPNGLGAPSAGMVKIEHVSVTGRNDVIERAVADAIPLFWRFVWEKFGIASNSPGR
jgi:hypothetical protein